MARVWSERIGAEIEEFMRKSLSRFRDGVCPIFFTATHDSRTHCIASGVLLRLAEHHFVLTAAHVTDQRQLGSLSLPGRHGNPGLNGHYAGMRLPRSGNRRDDRYDIAYIRLTAETVEALHPALIFLEWGDLDVFDTTVEKDAYSFLGYPVRNSDVRGNTIVTDLGSFSGDGAASDEYERLGYNPQHHILIRFRRHKAVNYGAGLRQTAAHPEGLSGGPVVAWNKYIDEKEQLPPPPKLVGILTTYHESAHHLVATRINCFLECIWKNNPELPFGYLPPFDHRKRPA
jgi:hypothetical protein